MSAATPSDTPEVQRRYGGYWRKPKKLTNSGHDWCALAGAAAALS